MSVPAMLQYRGQVKIEVAERNHGPRSGSRLKELTLVSQLSSPSVLILDVDCNWSAFVGVDECIRVGKPGVSAVTISTVQLFKSSDPLNCNEKAIIFMFPLR